MTKVADDPSDISGGIGSTAMEEQARQLATLKRTALLQFAFLMLGLVATLVANDLAWSHRPEGPWFPDEDAETVVLLLRGGATLTTLASLHQQTRYYRTSVALLRRRNLVAPGTGLLGSPLGGAFLLELALVALHVFPGIETLADGPALFVLCCFTTCSRVLLVARPLRWLSSFNSTNGRFISALTSVEFTTPFVLKTLVKLRPARSLAACLVGVLLWGGYLLHVSETALCAYDDALGCASPAGLDFWDAAWLVGVTALTVGFGDVAAHSHPGRVVLGVAAVSGVLLSAVAMASTSAVLSLSRSESKVLTFLHKDANRKRTVHNAAVVLQRTWKYYHAGMDAHPCVNSATDSHVPRAASKARAQQQLYRAMREQRVHKRQAHVNDGSDPQDRNLTLLEALDVSVDEIREKLEALEDQLLPPATKRALENGTAAAAAAAELGAPAAPGDDQPDLGHAPDWARPLERGLDAVLRRLDEARRDVDDLGLRFRAHAERTDARLAALEALRGS